MRIGLTDFEIRRFAVELETRDRIARASARSFGRALAIATSWAVLAQAVGIPGIVWIGVVAAVSVAAVVWATR